MDPQDEVFEEFWSDYDIEVDAKLECGKVAFFVDCYLHTDLKQIYITSQGFWDEASLGRTYPIQVTLTNELDQQNIFTIEIVAVVPAIEDDEPDPVVVHVDGVEDVQQIEVEYVVVDLKGEMQIKFAQFIYANETADLPV